MHAYSRPSPRTASPANSLQTNPTRTNNQRHTTQDSSPYSTTPPYSDRGVDESEGEIMSRGDPSAETDQKHYHKVNQVIQNFFTKAALTIVSSRIALPPGYNKSGEQKQNKWFNVVLPDSDELQRQLGEWKNMDAMTGQHPPLCIEIYLDVQFLGHKQSLVIHDEEGKRWDVGSALNAAEAASRSSRHGKPTQLVLERWMIHVGDKSLVHPTELNDPLPNVYKKAVVTFRSLFAHLRLMPAFRYNKIAAKQPTTHPALKLNYRITESDSWTSRMDTLNLALYPSSEAVTETIDFKPTNSPVGPLCVTVQHRASCDFSVEDSESLLSDQFMGLDDNYFEPKTRTTQVPGSLPVDRLNAQETPDVGQAYGSLSTFHQVGPPTGTSPISALRAVRDLPSSSPIESPPQKLPPNHRVAQGSKSSLRSADTPSYQRRTSVSFQPFKAGSLSSSPAIGGVLPSPSSSLGRPGSSLGRTPSVLNQPRNRTSLTALPQTALRAPSLPNDTVFASSASSSPKPAPISRYSSSFGHRRSKFSTGGGSKLDDDNLSSGKGSVSSSLQRGSDTLNDGPGGSSGEVKTDDENISDFLKLLESKKDLRSFNRSDDASKVATTQRTSAQLNKYQRMRDSHTQLSDSVSSSMMLHRSSSSSSRQLSSVPAMIAGTSVSTASSPGKPISPHTPHTPAIPSRLSANSIIEYEPRRSSQTRRGRATRGTAPDRAHVAEQSENEDQANDGIAIPNPPRLWNYARRSSSVAQQNRNLPDDEPDVFGVRSASLPSEEVDRARDLHRITSTDLTSSGLFAQTESLASASRDQHPANDGSRDDLPRPSSTSNIPPKRGSYSGGPRGRGGFFSHSSSTSLSTGATSSTERQSRYNFNSRAATTVDDDEPLLFQMSEIGTGGSRRSLEEVRGGSSSGGVGKRGSYFR
ncbi:hypothetical protein T440DRAFT_119722 [Plenodomus tracheiphilus IPT5]|uniref:Autophagy-related protein 13 n=1 Tax=Plenodomus tracheiphilus IPT5 TaxID=1408161 RepID=A0A6A7B325_9PLEO|nr:hypothetical protein T440DRAFT_119722 [Plenodomus tracheiphilus IPT5]